MRLRPALLAATALLVSAGCMTATRGIAPVPATWAADEAEIRALTTASTEAWNRGDLKGHLAIYVDSVTFMMRQGPRPGVAAIEESFTRTYFRDGKPKQQLRFEQAEEVHPARKPLDDVGAREVVGGCGERDARHARVALVQQAQLQIVFAEVVAPLAHAMRLVDGEQAELRLTEQIAEPLARGALGRDIEDVERTGGKVGLHAALLAEIERGVEERRADAERREFVARLESLSPRERDVVDGLVKGHANKVIAFDFEEALTFEGDSGPYLQYSTVRVQNIFRKMAERGMRPLLECFSDWQCWRKRWCRWRSPHSTPATSTVWGPVTLARASKVVQLAMRRL